ncbi:MAG: lipase family protein [Gemmataceae bacterium]
MSNDRQDDVPTVTDLCPPNLNHPYFEGSNLPPFDPTATGYSPANAWWLAEASLLAYGGPALFDRVRNADNVLARDRVRLETLDDGHENGVLILSTERFAIVAFRGTRVLGLQNPLAFGQSLKPHLRDVVTDIQFVQVPFEPGNVHQGFLAAYDQLTEKLDPRLAQWRDRDIWFTGHSLGAALATIAAGRNGHARALYTFGSPRVGDMLFGTAFTDLPCFRIVHQDDIVVRLPPPRIPWVSSATYRHVGNLIFIERDGHMDLTRAPKPYLDVFAGQMDWEAIKRGWQDIVNDVTTIIGRPPSIKNFTDLPVPRNSVTDHAPIFYTRHLKRQLAR